MKGEKSWTRKHYEHAYRVFRTGGNIELTARLIGFGNDIIRAADYSYQAKDYDVHGWSNNCRRARFHAIKYRSFSFPEDIPF